MRKINVPLKLVLFFTLGLLPTLLFSCKPEIEKGVDPEISVNGEDDITIEFSDSNMAPVTVTIDSNSDWTLSYEDEAAKSWCTTNISKGLANTKTDLIITVQEATQTRSTTLRLVASNTYMGEEESEDVEILIKQTVTPIPDPELEVTTKNLSFIALGETKSTSFSVENLNEYKVFTKIEGDGANQFSATIDNNKINVVAKANTLEEVMSANMIVYIAENENSEVMDQETVKLSQLAYVPPAILIKDVLAMPLESEVEFSAQIVGKTKYTLLVADISGAIVVYTATESEFNIGQSINIKGSTENSIFLDITQISQSGLEVKESSTPVEYNKPTPIEMSYGDIDTYLGSDQKNYLYASVEGVYKESAYSNNIDIESTYKNVKIENPSDEFDSLINKEVTAEGWVVGGSFDMSMYVDSMVENNNGGGGDLPYTPIGEDIEFTPATVLYQEYAEEGGSEIVLFLFSQETTPDKPYIFSGYTIRVTLNTTGGIAPGTYTVLSTEVGSDGSYAFEVGKFVPAFTTELFGTTLHLGTNCSDYRSYNDERFTYADQGEITISMDGDNYNISVNLSSSDDGHTIKSSYVGIIEEVISDY